MGFNVAILILLCGLAGELIAGTAPPRSQCLSCHASHYRERGTCGDCHHGNPGTIRKNIAHTNLIPGSYAFFNFSASAQVRNGKQLIDHLGCRRCHSVFGTGNKAASNLDLLFAASSPQMIEHAIRYPAQQMPDFRFNRQQLTEIVNAIEAAGKAAGKRGQETPQVIHFSRMGKKNENSFEKNCGGCHKFLSTHSGGLGGGDIGPNLSGLFSEFYPANFRGEERWNRNNLQKWLQNPRTIRPNTTMRPVALKQEELDVIVRNLR